MPSLLTRHCLNVLEWIGVHSKNRRDVSLWDVVAQDWRIPTGDFIFFLGFSSRDIKKEVRMDLT